MSKRTIVLLYFVLQKIKKHDSSFVLFRHRIIRTKITPFVQYSEKLKCEIIKIELLINTTNNSRCKSLLLEIIHGSFYRKKIRSVGDSRLF